MPITDLSKRTEWFSVEQFRYDAVRDLYVCPQGPELKLHSRRSREQVLVYRAKRKLCNGCPAKPRCNASRSRRHIVRSFFQDYLDRVRAYAQTEEFKKALRKRQVWVEPLFGEAKQWHQGARFRWRGLQKVNIQGMFTAAGQNLKRWLQWKEGQRARGQAEDRSVQFLLRVRTEFANPFRHSIQLFQHAGIISDVQFIAKKTRS